MSKNQEFLKSNDITWRERKPGLDDIYNCYRKLAKRYGADYENYLTGIKAMV